MSGAWGHSFLVVQSTPPIETDLVTLDDLKLELGITGTAEDAALQTRITRLSEQIAEYCDRIFALIEVEETFAFSGSGRLCPCYSATHPIPLVLMQYPVTEITSPTLQALSLVTMMSLEPSAALPLPSWRWIQFTPRMPPLYFTTLPRNVTCVPASAVRVFHTTATVVAFR